LGDKRPSGKGAVEKKKGRRGSVPGDGSPVRDVPPLARGTEQGKGPQQKPPTETRVHTHPPTEVERSEWERRKDKFDEYLTAELLEKWVEATMLSQQEKEKARAHPGYGAGLGELPRLPPPPGAGEREQRRAVAGESGGDLGKDVRPKKTAYTNQVHTGKEALQRESVRRDPGPQGKPRVHKIVVRDGSPDECEDPRVARSWGLLVQMDAEGDPLGPMAERILYRGPILGVQPGRQDGLMCEFTGVPPELAYKVTLDVAEKALKAELQLRAAEMRASIRQHGMDGAKQGRAGWTALLRQLLVEKRVGQIAELFRRTERIITSWEEELIPEYVARVASLEQTVEESEAELEQRVQKMYRRGKLKQHLKGERRDGSRRDAAPPLSKRAVGPQETNPPGVDQNDRIERRQPRIPDERAMAQMVERACAEREASMLAQIEGLLRQQIAERRPLSPVRASSRKRELYQGQSASELPSAGLEQSPVGELDQSRGMKPSSHPVLRRYFQSPYVDAAQKFQEEEREEKVKRERSTRRRRHKRDDSSASTSDAEETGEHRVPTSVKFKDRIKSFPKFSRPDGSFTWTDFLTQLVEILEQYRVPSHEWSAWLIDRLAGKAQSALLNLTVAQRKDWPTLVSALNSYFHVEFEMRAAEEELLTRKQGNKESVRDFLNQLMFLARKAYGQDLEKREAAVLKRIELGLASASLRRTFDDLILIPGVTLSVINAELVKRESRDEPGKYQQFVVQEQAAESARKPNNPPAATLAKEIASELVGQQGGAEGQVNLAPAVTPAESGTGRDQTAAAGRGQGRASGAAEGKPVGKPSGEPACWNCGEKGDFRSSCPQATEEDLKEWKALRRGNKTGSRGSRRRRGGKGSGAANAVLPEVSPPGSEPED